MIDVTETRRKQQKFLTDTSDARVLSEKCRDYYDGKQWTAHEEQVLKARNQAPIVSNKIKPKVEGLIGLYDMRKSEPKAYPRTQKHEDSGHVVTDGLRFVTQRNDFDTIRGDVAEDFFVEGYGGAIVDVKQDKKGEMWINIRQIPWDRIYFDPHSRKKDFSDARWMGVIVWLYRDEAKEMFPGKDSLFDELVEHGYGFTDETFEDKPRFVDKEADRLRISLHFEIYKSTWHMGVNCGDTWIESARVSPFLDDEGEPTCPIELVSAYVDREGNRYGETRHMLDSQDEINHRRSKFLHQLNSRQTFGRKGDKGGKDILKIKAELKKPDGHVEFDGEQFGKDFGVLPSAGAESGQFELYLDAKQEMAATAHQANLQEANQQGALSGRAIARLQQTDTIEINRQYGRLKNWELRIYRQIWARIKQFWNEEKWIRVTDDQDALRWVGFNTPITVQERLEEVINDESMEFHVRRVAAAQYTQLMEAQDPRLQEAIEVRNPIAELDVDLILDQSFDVINMEEEQFQMLAQFAQGGDVDILDLIEVSNLRGKEDLIEKIEARRQAALEQAGGQAQLQANESQAKTENMQADTAKKFVEAQQKQVETQNLIMNPDPQVQAVV